MQHPLNIYYQQHPLKTARDLADALRQDTVAAGQIKEHIKPKELYELLGLEAPQPEPETIQDALAQAGFSRREALTSVCKYFTESEVIEELEKHR